MYLVYFSILHGSLFYFLPLSPASVLCQCGWIRRESTRHVYFIKSFERANRDKEQKIKVGPLHAVHQMHFYCNPKQTKVGKNCFSYPSPSTPRWLVIHSYGK